MKRSFALSLGAASLLVGGLALAPGAVKAGTGSPDAAAVGTKAGQKAAANDQEKKAEREFDRDVLYLGGPAHAGFLGVGLADVEGSARGAEVKSVEKDSPAEKAGFEEGDVIVRFDGEGVRSAAQLARLVRETPPGRAVEVEVERKGAKRTLTATLGERRGPWPMAGPFGPGQHFGMEGPELAPPPPGLPGGPHVFAWRGDGDRQFAFPWAPERPRKLGIRYMEISGQLAAYFKIAGGQGVLVTSVDENGPAAKAGMKAGDVILAVGGTAIKDGDDLRDKIGDTEGGTQVAVKVQRDGRPLDLEVTLAKPEGEGPHHRPAGVSL
jgi:membrane-associated protease RseP (regulator of RpoE activity)